MSLRARLIALLLALAAAGLVTLAAVTYAEQRSFLLDRVDQQARGAAPAVEHSLAARGIGGAPAPGRGDFGSGRAPGPGGPDPDGRGPPGSAAVNLPPGTFGQRRDASGKVLGSVVLSYGQRSYPTPRLPAHLAPGRPVTVGARGGSGARYRVLATPDPDASGTTVVAVPLRDVDQTLHRLRLVQSLVIAGVLAALALLSWALVRLGLRPLERIGTTAGAIAAGDLSRRVSPATPRTEVGRLGLALNAMLERLERAFAERRASEDRLRRFLADASHELRTPLASIRGYAELFRTGAARDPDNSAKAMRRIEDEAARMGVLVDDLLTLARLEEPRPEVRRRVDLSALADDAVDDARATDPDRPIELHGSPGAVVMGDPHGLRQVVGNLVRNALVHTPPGTPVEVSVRRDGAQLELEVRDHGPGLPPDGAGSLFERFWRSEPGRGRGPGGAGLGLAIVAGVVDAHDGSVRAAQAPGGGASFVVRLPGAELSADSQEARTRSPGDASSMVPSTD